MQLRLTGKQQESGNAWTFYFDAFDPTTTWVAGQSIRLFVPRDDGGTENRRFTIASAPYEKHMQITTRISESDFKQILSRLDIGTVIEGHDVEGDFVWGEEKLPRLFLIGGIGITPFRTMVGDAIHRKQPLDATLIYSTRDEPPIFGAEIEKWATDHDDLRVTIAHERLSVDLITEHAPNWQQSLVYLSGGHDMVEEFSKVLLDAGLPESQLKLDEFSNTY